MLKLRRVGKTQIAPTLSCERLGLAKQHNVNLGMTLSPSYPGAAAGAEKRQESDVPTQITKRLIRKVAHLHGEPVK